MNIREMIEQLEEIAQAHGDEIEVRIAEQPHWPFENSISQIVAVNLSEETCEVCQGSQEDDDGNKCDNCDGSGIYREENKTEDEFFVYIAEGQQIGYLPGAVSSELGWR